MTNQNKLTISFLNLKCYISPWENTSVGHKTSEQVKQVCYLELHEIYFFQFMTKIRFNSK